ncbi:phenylacetic acid degradation operon negative regulatory protein PaaX [Enterovirga rhinocerotis]|uniref:PaaX family transcriptional regulator n=1 Tax=Enterovirga rhinocerotis TaxID=1339210 RepID=A0A4R7C8T4_9HYPH|nr:phenylacetic acid degradation operon negative regulatory protein PaaX [Enterovirga rhinocerotis]TDR94848.1 PaaX family transcriptional regulator [Enterovirga rhinocerotis]
MASVALDGIMAGLRREPSRTGSLVVTIFGDAIAPRGGSVWLGTLLAFFRGVAIEDGAVRTAMSRLTADGWLERRRAGRNSFYRLASHGRATFEAATRQIYVPRHPVWDGRLTCLVVSDREAGAALGETGFGQAVPGLWIAPGTPPVPEAASAAIRLEARVDAAARRRLAAEAWPVDRMAASYRRFLDMFAPLRDEIAAGLVLTPSEAFAARILTIHFYRRVILRDPGLPLDLLPEHWPGELARRLSAELYAMVLEPSEAWLDENGLDENGPLPPAGDVLRRRFQEE